MFTTDRKQKLIEIFEDTQRFYAENAVLAAAVERTRRQTRLYGPDEYPELPEALAGRGEVRLMDARSFEAAMQLRREFPEAKIAVLNFASATRPGGGVKNGSTAQEEALCRCSTLYASLDQRFLWQNYYDVHRAAQDARYTDACIVSPGIVICKTDTDFPERLPQERFVTVDVISCAAPNLREQPSNRYNPQGGRAVKVTPKELYGLHCSRARHILHAAALHGARVLVLGAFGCGAFQNNPKVVAAAWHSVLEPARTCFDLTVFAIPRGRTDTANYDAFSMEFEKN